MTEEQYKHFKQTIEDKGYKLVNHPNTIHNESFYYYKGFAYTEDEDGECTPGYQIIFLVWERFHMTHIPNMDAYGVTPLILTNNHEWERIDLEITDDKVNDVDSVEQFAHDFYYKFLLVHGL